MRKKKITPEEVQRAIGRGYLAGHRDGAKDFAYVNGSWLSAVAREEADLAIEEMDERRAHKEFLEALATDVQDLIQSLGDTPLASASEDIVSFILKGNLTRISHG